MPHCTGKLFLWLLSEAKYKPSRFLQPGQVQHSVRFMCEALEYVGVENHKPMRPSSHTILKGLKRLVEGGYITQKKEPTHTTVITICNWEVYQQEIGGGCNTNSNTDSNKLKKGKEGTTKKPYVASDEARACFRAWHQRRPLDTKQESTYCKTFDDIHRIDKESWEEIHAVCKYALTEWEAKHIQSPTKLRRPSSTYPEKKVYEVIRDQMQSKPEAPAVPTLEEMRRKIGVN